LDIGVFEIGVCDMCGSENRLFKTEIEGTLLNVCKHCAKFGKVVANVHDKKFIQKMQKKQEKQKRPQLLSKNELVETLVEDFATLIKEKREKLNLKQEDFAKKINEKASIIHKIETGHFEPNINLARKIERFLKVKIVEQQESRSPQLEKTASDSFTLGDFIKVK
jgi:putative transcription factor